MQRSALIAAQNPDGGWPYRRGSSRLEPTVFALLALNRQREGASEAAAGRALGWLRMNQRPDGGWAPAPSVEESTWVTALPLLLPARQLGSPAQARALAWLARRTSADATFWYRLRETVRGRPVERFEGWSWYPGTAAWVTPTAYAMLGLRAAAPAHPRIAAGCGFLLSRCCRDGGWNYGAARALGFDAASYPETTGLALLALPPDAGLAASVAAAEKHLRETRSAEAAAWLHMALRAHGRDPGPWPADIRPRNWRDLALCLLAADGAAGLITRTAA